MDKLAIKILLLSIIPVSAFIGTISIVNSTNTPRLAEHPAVSNETSPSKPTENDPLNDRPEDTSTNESEALSNNTAIQTDPKQNPTTAKTAPVLIPEVSERKNEVYNEDSSIVADASSDDEEAKAAAKNASLNSGASLISNSYPNASSCPQMHNTTTTCQSISYANWKVEEYWGKPATEFGITGNAKDWCTAASTIGLRVDDIPSSHSVGCQTSNFGHFGHVVWVEGVNADGTINLSEYNNSYSSANGQAGNFGFQINVPASNFRYIHFD